MTPVIPGAQAQRKKETTTTLPLADGIFIYGDLERNSGQHPKNRFISLSYGLIPPMCWKPSFLDLGRSPGSPGSYFRRRSQDQWWSLPVELG